MGIEGTKEKIWGRTGLSKSEKKWHKKYDKIIEKKYRNYTLIEFLNLFPSPK